MESKPNACCANCELLCAVKNVMNKTVPAWLNDLCCEQYKGPGLTPQMEIEKLKEENRRFREAYDTASGYVRASKYNILESKKERYWRAVETLKECHQIIKFGKVKKKMKDKNGIQICCENCACEQCGLDTYEHWRQACIEKDFADFKPSQTAYDKRIAELEAECERLRTDENPTLLKGEEVIAIAEKVIASAPVAKPIVWEQLSESIWNGYCNKLISFSICNGYNGDDAYSLIGYINGVDIKAFVDIPFHTLEAAKQAAQDWLNKLVAECAVMGNPRTQFTAEEIAHIKKIHELPVIRLYPQASAIAAKCDAMLKGGNNER